MKKKIFTLCLCAFLITGCTKIPTLKNGEEAVVTFKDKSKISADTLYKDIKNQYGLSALINMIDKQILEDKYKDSLNDAKKEAEDQIAQYKEYYGDDLESTIQSQTQFASIEEFQEYLQLVSLQNKAIKDYSESKVTEKDIKSYYKSDIKGDIQCSHILITPIVTDDMTDDEKTKAEAAALKEAKEVIAKIKKSKDLKTTFTALAKEYSDDKNTSEKGGDLGYFNKGDMTEAFETAAYKLKDGEYTTTPVKTTYGYHIIYRVATKGKAKIADVRDKIITSLGASKLEKNPIYQVDALTELRDEYGINFIDSELKTQYANYIQNLIASVTKKDDKSNTN